MSSKILSRLGIVVLNFGDPSDTKNLIVSLLPHIEAEEIYLCVVDNFSTMNNRAELAIFCDALDEISFLPVDSNGGYGAGNNLGLQRVFDDLGCDVALVLNPDIEIEESFSLKELREISGDSECLIGGFVSQHNCRTSAFEFSPYLTTSKPVDASRVEGSRPIYVSGCCVALTKSVWTITNGFAEDFFLYFDELDLIYRYRKVKGFFPKIISLRTLAATHFEGASTGTSPVLGEMSVFAEYWSARSRILFYRKHLFMLVSLAAGRNLVKAFLLLSGAKHAQARSIIKGTYHGFRFRL